ncbi:aminotransferase class V-fold PLP-dependent enzyme [bacterium 1XD42-94]|nr:aminotransferase class V-fold PLP-dependent enzyme [bacterium 1XD42-76]NBK06113.1 aminotransferase class V-fold PLP-dependent enzyme [bacterium 1XD42-94]
MIYLDNAATTYPKSESVYQALDEANRNYAFNAGRGSYAKARIATEIIDTTKKQIKGLVNAAVNSSVIFTPSITIALNQILQGIDFCKGDNIYYSPYEHNAVARTLHLIKSRMDVNLLEMPINESTLEIDVEKLKYEFSVNPPRCVCCTHISNVTGYVLPVTEIFECASHYNAITVLDTAQSLGVEKIDMVKMNVSFLAFTGHKSLYGPLGIGGFVDAGKIKINQIMAGGTGSNSLILDMPSESPERYEFASSNIVAIAGLSQAIKEIDVNKLIEEEKLVKRLIDGLSQIEDIDLYVPISGKHRNIVSFNLKNYKSGELGIILDNDFEIAVRTGYHCAPFIHRWLKDEKYLGTVRVGIGKFNTKEDIDALLEAIREISEE